MDPTFVGYVDVGYKFDPITINSQTDYLFLLHGVAISWKSVKQTITTTSFNHAKIIALHEASWECIWLRSIDKFIRTNCGLPYDDSLTILYEDNCIYVAQMQLGFVKGD